MYNYTRNLLKMTIFVTNQIIGEKNMLDAFWLNNAVFKNL